MKSACAIQTSSLFRQTSSRASSIARHPSELILLCDQIKRTVVKRQEAIHDRAHEYPPTQSSDLHSLENPKCKPSTNTQTLTTNLRNFSRKNPCIVEIKQLVIHASINFSNPINLPPVIYIYKHLKMPLSCSCHANPAMN